VTAEDLQSIQLIAPRTSQTFRYSSASIIDVH